MTPRHRLAAVVLALSLAAPGTGSACAFHTYAPAPTVVDQMLGSAQIVYARPDPEDPARFVAVEAISGPVGDVGIADPVDRATRRRLAAHPTHRVLFARDGSYGPWQRLAYLDDDYRAVIDRVAARLEDWQMGGDEERAQMFADLLNHENPALRSLALSELDIVPYDVLRGLDIASSAPALLADIEAGASPDLLPIRVLLLGLSGDRAALPVLIAGVDGGLATAGGTNRTLGAYATALIELQGVEGARHVADALSGRAGQTGQTTNAAEMLIEALAIHNQTGDAGLRAEISARIDAVLQHSPELAAAVARQFASRYDWSQADRLAALLKAKKLRSAPTVIAVTQYIALARESAGAAAGD